MRVYLRTLGCRANQYDTEQVRAMIERGGHEVVGAAAAADVAIFNSCAVTAEAEADLRQGVRRAARERPAIRTVIMGCASARDPESLAALPGVERVIAGADYAEIAAALGLDRAALGTAETQTGSRALLRIQEGCDEHCTFCATTLARGASRSRPAADLIAEATRLAARHPEIVLTGIHIGAYGLDIGSSLAELVAALVRDVPVVRFRLSSVEATEVDDRLLELFGEPARLAPHLHAPLQSGADAVLRRMGRHWYTAREYAATVERLAARRPVLGLGADVIAGFPGETEAQHARTVSLVTALPFTYLHVFPYSPRPGTAAERLGGALGGGMVAGRARELREAGEEKARRYRATRVGGLADVVVVRGGGERGRGLTEDHLTVDLADPGLPRGGRIEARLSGTAAELIATPHSTIVTG